jgi:hypothetical protein
MATIEQYSSYNKTDSSFALNLHGYSELAIVDLIIDNESETDQYLNQLNLSISNDSTGTPSKIGNTNYYCNINFSVNTSFQLPDFMTKPSPNLTLFKKADEFSYEISKLNDTLIQILQQMDCCNFSDQYNKTVVPIFRYFASSKDHSTCGISPNLEPDSCGGDSNFMKEILRVVKDITKTYTAIEPLFCLVSPIPGNPWLPIDFNWTAPIMPYIQAFQQLMDKIMSGSLFDIIIDPIKDLNRMLINCTANKTRRSISRLNRISNTEINNDIIKLMDDVSTTKEEIANTKTSVITNKLYNVEGQSKIAAANLTAKKAEEDAVFDVMTKYSPVAEIPSNASSTAYKLQQIRNPGQGICRCLLQLSGLEVRLPKFPKAEIRMLQNTAGINNINNNDLLKYNNETAYTIRVSDVVPNDVTTNKTIGNFITFTSSLSTDPNFIEQFKTFMDKDAGSTKLYYGTDLISALNSSDISPDTEISKQDFIDRFNLNLPDVQFKYTDKSEYIKETIREFNPYLSEGILGTSINYNKSGPAPATTIINNNISFVEQIKEIQNKEVLYSQKIEEIILLDKKYWKESKIKAQLAIKQLNLKDANDFEFNGIDETMMNNMYLDFFGSYWDIDINKDLTDSRIDEKLYWYGNIKDTTVYNICLDYVNYRKSLTFFDEVSGENYKEYAIEQINHCKYQFETIINKYHRKLPLVDNKDNLISDIGTVINTNLETFKYQNEGSDYLEYQEEINTFLLNPFGQLFLDTLLNEYYNEKRNFKVYIKDNVIFIDTIYFSEMITWVKDTLISNLPEITISGQQYNFLYYSIKILQCEEYKLTLFKALEENVAYDFYLSTYPEVDCGCDTIVCKLIQMVIDFILYYVNMFLGWLMQMLLEYLIPKWLRALIDLIIYKLKCILQIVYMNDTMDLIDRVYENFLNNLKYRVNNYPYENCVNTALDNALAQINEDFQEVTGDDTANITYDEAEDELRNHKIQIDFVDINKRPISNTSLSKFNTINIMVTYDIGAIIESVKLTDATVLGDSTSIELITQESNISKDQKIYIVDIPLDKIISGELKVQVKSVKSFADVPIKYDTSILKILDYINDDEMRFILMDYKTSDYNIFLERNKETLSVNFSILEVPSLGDPTKNLFLIKNYISSIILYDKVPEGMEALPSINLVQDELVKDTRYSENTGLFTIIVDCTNFFPISRNINAIIKTNSIYNGASIELTDSIYCQGEDIQLTSNDGTVPDSGDFTDTIIYSNNVTVPNNINTTEDDRLNNTIQVRQSTPLFFDCTVLDSKIGVGTSAGILSLNKELRNIWEDLGLV